MNETGQLPGSVPRRQHPLQFHPAPLDESVEGSPVLGSTAPPGADANPTPDSNQGLWNFWNTPIHGREQSVIAETSPLTGVGHHFLYPAEDSVYSYFMFIPPIEQRRTKKFLTPLIVFAILLVLINFVMQVGLLVVVGNHIMKKHNKWVGSVMHVKHVAWYHIFPMPYNYAPPVCRGTDSTMCFDKGDGVSCAPPMIHVLTDWKKLDTDGDGVWSKEEAQNEALRERVLCDYGVDALSLYTSVAQHINSSSIMEGRRNADLMSGVGVHKSYFNWFLHKPLLCQYGDADMCGTLFQRGFFDQAFSEKVSAEFANPATALEYCTALLQHECFDILPNTYKVWRSRQTMECGERKFGQTMYQLPGDDSAKLVDKVPMLSVGFLVQDMYASTKTLGFRLFLCILLVTFLSVMALEWRSIMRALMWCLQFPKDLQAGQDGQVVGKKAVRMAVKKTDDESSTTSDEEFGGGDPTKSWMTQYDDPQRHSSHTEIRKSIHSVRTDHRIAVTIVTVFRLLLWFFLLWSGIMFLTGKPRYLTLIFDALSLLFIFEIDELLYRTMLRHEFQTDHLEIEDIRVVNTFAWFRVSGRKSVMMDILSFLGLVAFSICIVYTYCHAELNPMIDALGCLCSKDGPRCHEAQAFSKTWWDTYWSRTLPAANLIIDQVKLA